MMTNNDAIHSIQRSMYDEDFYEKAINEFIRTTGCTLLQLHTQDPMSAYIISTTQNPEIRFRALQNKLGNRVYTDTLLLFVSQYLQKINFYKQRCRFEEEQIRDAQQWSIEKLEKEWKEIVNKIELKYGGQGFSSKFYLHEWAHTPLANHAALWSNLLGEWQHHLNLGLQLQKQNYLQLHQAQQNQILLNNLTATQTYVEKKNLSSEDVFQTLALMGGRWTTVEFDRLLRITLLQHKYPLLIDIAQRMGRIPDPNGSRHMQAVSGMNALMRSSSPNDITGIGIGRDLDSLLPTEMAFFADSELYDVFLKKYVTGRLQTFDHKSRMLHTARSLRTQTASIKGPIIVCMDTSGSMMGEPSQIALSLMMRLTEMCMNQDRECFLITFSVLAQPIDVRRNRAQLMQYFTRPSTGNTDAKRMIEQMHEVLEKDQQYAGADILWISDFRIPLPPPEYFQLLERLKQAGTRLYGLQIGIAENHWLPYFDHIYQLEEVKMAII